MSRHASDTYDFVILGAGSAGSVLAARLSENRTSKVLLVEAGGEADSLFVRMPAGNGFLFGNPRFDWGYETEPQGALGGRRIYCPRGKGLGGTSLLNGMIATRGHPSDYDRWGAGGLSGWSYSDILPYFRLSEGSWRGTDRYHGGTGPLRLQPSPNYLEIDRRFIAACREAGHAENPDVMGARQLGAFRVDVTVDRGRRMSVARAYLAPARRRRNLEVLTGTRALRILVEKNRATGAEIAGAAGTRVVRAAREVIVSLGAYASPQLLMLSGIGPAAELRRHGLDVVADIPGVGRNLQDHVNVPVQFACSDPALSFARWQRLDRALWLGARYVLTGGGPGAGPFWSTCLFSALVPDGEAADLQTFFTPMVVVEDLFARENTGRRSSGLDLEELGARFLSRGRRALAGFQLDVNPVDPESRGSVMLRSADPSDPPRIDPRMLSLESEQRIAVKGVRLAREIAAQPALASVSKGEISPGTSVKDDAAILEAVRRLANTAHHPVGTCRMGAAREADAVVAGDLKVRGIEGLRVVDASIFPRQIRANPNMTVVAIAEKASHHILGTELLKPEGPA